ncbi:MAG: efflux RND transporter periplasmic adaptor subunit [Candidatus Acidiferrum sp.]|jgi:putative peptide zinc metalloprotease protein
MNLNQALNVALPEIPARTLAQRYPRVDPEATFKTHLEDGEMVVRLYSPSTGLMYTLPERNWNLVRLFDGKRTYEEIAALYSAQIGSVYDAQAVREFAGELEAGDFWYKTAQERNILLMQQNSEDRQKKWNVKSRYADLSMILFPAFNPDKFLTKLYGWTAWIYTTWFTLITLAAFAFATAITVIHWPEIGRDTIQFYNFSDKTWSDIAVLYVLGMFVVAAHEYAHAHACKHYGGRVPAMGFALIYLTPAFYTDTTEGAVKGTRYQRLVISLAGIWIELIICAIATPIWWGTPPNTVIHDGAYFLMLLTGITSLLVNWNPLMKLDGYHMMCEMLGIVDLKENSTAYVSAWVKHHIWRLPVEVPYVPKSRRLGFIVYALLSGAYSYTVLYFVAGFVGNVFRNFDPQWSFLPELGTAFLIFRSRIRLLVNFMKFVYLDKKDRVHAWFTVPRRIGLAAAVAAFLLVPLWRDSVSGHFVLEPQTASEVRAAVPGMVDAVYTWEGQQVTAGAPLLQLRNLPLQSEISRANAEYALASKRATSAVLHFGEMGATAVNRDRLGSERGELGKAAAKLNIASPISGTVLTPRLQDRLGSYVNEGADLVEVADLSQMRARIYVSEYDLYKCQVGAAARVEIDGRLGIQDARASAITEAPSEIDPSLSEANKLKGLNAPNFYLVDLLLSNSDGRMKPGMRGLARIYGSRRSIAAMGWEAVSHFVGRKLW